MISFENDYNVGAHPRILERLTETNFEVLSGYGTDEYCSRAKEKIRAACQCPEAEVEFLVGGTQMNEVVIATALKDYEGVVAADTGHVSTHEAGAIEFMGHKVLTLPASQGKIGAKDLRQMLEDFYNDGNHEHMVFPGMVYISYPTEYGTLYKKSELEELAEVCHAYEIPLYIDGARLGYGLRSRECDLTLADIAKIADIFYIGGTKAGALCGEAVVFTKHNRPKHFINAMKKRGGLLAKGRLLGVQFDTLFTDDLYLEIAENAIVMAEKLKKILHEKQMRFYLESPTNQQFVILENQQLKELEKEVKFSFWEKYDDTHTVVRFATSWSTKEEDLEKLAEILEG